MVSVGAQNTRLNMRYSPNHKLIVATAFVMVDISSGEEIVCNIAADVGVRVAPLCRGLQVAELADQLLCDLTSGVDIALHVVVTACPLPIRAPLDAASRQAIDVRALRARRGGASSPKVVVELVPIGLEIGVLVA